MAFDTSRTHLMKENIFEERLKAERAVRVSVEELDWIPVARI